MDAFTIAVAVVFLAELGDKSQLLALTLATRRPAGQVLLGVALAALLLQGLSAGAGAALASAVPTSVVLAAAGGGFLLAAVLTLRGSDDPPAPLTVRSVGSTVLLAFAAMLVAELGDKTMLATAALATTQPAVPTWLGGTVGFVLADLLAVIGGRALLRRLPLRAVRMGTAAVLAGFGVVLLATLA